MKKIVKLDDKIFFIKTIDMSKKKFLKLFFVKKNTYLYQLYSRLYDYIAGNSINLYEEYKNYYANEYDTFDSFLLEHYNLPKDLVKIFNKNNSYYKYKDIGNEQPLYSLLMDETIKKIIIDFMGGFVYED